MTAARGQRGASLVIVLALVAFLSLIVPAVLLLAASGARVGQLEREDRDDTYLAASALDAAIQNGRSARWVGRVGLDCVTIELAIDGHDAVVRCDSSTGAFDLDRTLRYTAFIDGEPRATADVIYRDSTAGAGEPAAEVTSWDADLDTPS